MNEPKSNSVNPSDTLTEQNSRFQGRDHEDHVGQIIDNEWGFQVNDVIHEKTDARRHMDQIDWRKTTITNKDKPTHVNFDHTINLMDEEDEWTPGNLPGDEELPPMAAQQLLDLIQIVNSNFPIGAFSHSFGIETYIRKELVYNGKTLKKAIRSYIFGQFLYLDLLGIRSVYQALETSNLQRVWQLDQMAHASGMSKETVDGARRIGTQMVKLYLQLFPDCQNLQAYQAEIDAGRCTGVPGVAFGLMAHYLQVDLKVALYAHLFSSTSAQIQNAVRAIPLGQVEGQRVMLHVKRDYFRAVIDLALNADINLEYCRNAPGLEIAQMEHEETNVRLFMS